MIIKSTINQSTLPKLISLISNEPDISSYLDHLLISKYESNFGAGVKVEIVSENLDFLQRVRNACGKEE